ncbi:HBL150Wp [Eremothecium sinecaudum]|uniref:General transcription and DNA repair factor IIH subunit TFB4 n=1 Tax=Eremothecium sinecaudum TaxID=45286 RepID=A0A120K0W3_9SACH|nr:HBL150Wp [Eremothecium sinecaudum]AMD18752.1 HBL150Wp [Eremothecium sinecaudum]
MDAIAESTFQHTKSKSHLLEDTPSLVTLVIDTNPKLWAELDKEVGNKGELMQALKSIIVFLNAHLAFNSGNEVSVIAAYTRGIKYLYPPADELEEPSSKRKLGEDRSIINKGMYRGFRNVDETVVEELYKLFQQELRDQEASDVNPVRSTLSGAMSAGLTYINRMVHQNEGISLKSRLLVITCGSSSGRDEIFQYIPIMNCIFSATKMKCPIDVVKIGGTKESTFLQQATDATNGNYLHVENTKGLIQYLCTAMFIDPSLRNQIVKPNQSSVDFRTSCYLTGKVVAVGFVCSVCLCVLSIIPPGNKCPACDSEFDEKVVGKLKRKPVVAGVAKNKKRNKVK